MTQRRLIAVINVDIGEGQQTKINLYDGEDEEKVARDFIKKHGLPQKVLNILHNKIVEAGRVARTHLVDEMRNTFDDELKTKSILQTQRTDLSSLETHTTSRMTKRLFRISNDEEDEDSSLPDTSSRLTRSVSSSNVVKRVYNENQIKQNYIKMIEYRANKKMAEPVEDHRPKINEVSRVLASQNNQKRYLQKNQRKIQKVQGEQCTFKPSISKISKLLTDQRPTNSFQKPIVRKLSQQCYPYTPQVNNISRIIVQSKGLSFEQRTKDYIQAKNEKIKQLFNEQRKKQIIDMESGRRLFHPSIRTKSRDRGTKNIGEYLYELSKVEKPVENLNRAFKPLQSSQEILRNAQARRIAWIFSELDSDQDGKISADRIDINTIPEAILELLSPILFQMQDFNFSLNLQDFHKAVESLSRSLTSEEKATLFDYKKK